MSTWHRIDSFWKTEPQLRKCHQIGLWRSLWCIFLIDDGCKWASHRGWCHHPRWSGWFRKADWVLHIVKVTTSPQLTYMVIAKIPIKVWMDFSLIFTELDKIILKVVWKYKRLQGAEIILKKTVEGLIFWFKILP